MLPSLRFLTLVALEDDVTMVSSSTSGPSYTSLGAPAVAMSPLVRVFLPAGVESSSSFECTESARSRRVVVALRDDVGRLALGVVDGRSAPAWTDSDDSAEGTLRMVDFCVLTVSPEV